MESKIRSVLSRLPQASLAGRGWTERMRSTAFALLGLVAAAGLAFVAIFSQAGWVDFSTGPAPSPTRSAAALSGAQSLGPEAHRSPTVRLPRGPVAASGSLRRQRRQQVEVRTRAPQPGGLSPAAGVRQPAATTPAAGADAVATPTPAPAPVQAQAPTEEPSQSAQPEAVPVSTPEKPTAPPSKATAATSSSTSRPGNSGSAPGHSAGSPGNSGSAPGHSGSAGNSGSAPGHSGGSPGNSGSAPGHAPAPQASTASVPQGPAPAPVASPAAAPTSAVSSAPGKGNGKGHAYGLTK